MKPLFAVLGLSAWMAQAHVTLVAPEGGETLQGGSTFTIVWDADDHDAVYHIHYSADGGTKWSVVALDIGKSTRTYKWKVPDSATTKGMLRVMQDNKTGTDLEGKSGTFRITRSTALRDGLRPGAALRVDFGAHQTRISWHADQAERVVIQAFDAQGAVVATWLDEDMPAGPHRVVRSHAAPSPGATVLRVRIGGHASVFTLPRLE